MTEVHITEGEVLRLHVQFRSDVEAYMKERGYLVDFEPEAECHALTLAIARERERCASPPFAIFEFDTGKPPVRATQEQVDAARKRFDRIMAAEIVEPENPCTHPAIEPQLVCEECGHRESILGQVDEMWAVISILASLGDCRLDHHGYCQAHDWMAPDCPHGRAQKLLKEGKR